MPGALRLPGLQNTHP